MHKKKISLSTGSTALLNVFSAAIAILIGLVIGIIMIFAFDAKKAGEGIADLLLTGFLNLPKMADVLYQTAPLMLTGLSIGFAFKTGLFNIGAPGQYTVGACIALYAALVLKAPWYVCLLLSMVGGAVWGFFPGFFKAVFNVNEVITAIMFNWIGLFAVNIFIGNTPAMQGVPASRTENIVLINPSGLIPKLGLDKIFGSNYINIGIFVSILVAVILHIVLNKTTFGYELKACGLNKNASIYAGINAKNRIICSMIIAGAISALGGGLYYLAGNANYVLETKLLAMGFNGIPVALLAASSPLGIIVSSLFIAYIKVGGNAMQPNYATETIDIIISVIIYLSAFSFVIKGWLAGKLNIGKKDTPDNPHVMESTEKEEKAE